MVVTDTVLAESDIRVDAPAAAEIGIVLYPEVQLAAVHGLTDLFRMAGWVVRTHGGPVAGGICVTHWQADERTGAVSCVFDSLPGPPADPSFVLVPSSLLSPPGPEAAAGLSGWLRERHAAGVTLASTCLASFLLAEVGLLSGRRATTHWNFAGAMAERFPDVRVDGDQLIVDEGDIITAGGLLAWVDLGLRLVGRILGPAIAVQTGRYLLFDPAGREQRTYSAFLPRYQHGDPAILAVQNWLQDKGPGPVSVEAMAAQARLGERTFLRRFHKATGLTPAEYHQRIRINVAREILELSSVAIKNVAWDVGYSDVAAFTRAFRRITGIPPSEYRRRFGIGALAGAASPTDIRGPAAAG